MSPGRRRSTVRPNQRSRIARWYRRAWHPDRVGRAAMARRGRAPRCRSLARPMTAEDRRVLEAAFWGLAGASTLLVGALLAMAFPWPRRAIGLVAGFGAGALISAVTLDLTASAFAAAGIPAVTIGLAARGGGVLDRERPDPPRRPRAPPQALARPPEGRPAGHPARHDPRWHPRVGRDRHHRCSRARGSGWRSWPRWRSRTSRRRSPRRRGSGLPTTRPAPPVPATARPGRFGACILLWLTVMLISAVAAGLGYALLAGAPPLRHRDDPGVRRRRGPRDAGRHDDAGGVRGRGPGGRRRHGVRLRDRDAPDAGVGRAGAGGGSRRGRRIAARERVAPEADRGAGHDRRAGETPGGFGAGSRGPAAGSQSE